MSPDEAYAAQFNNKGPASFRTGAVVGNVASNAKPVAPTTAVTPKLGAIGQVVDKVAAVGHEALNIGASVAKATANFAVNAPKYIYNDVQPFLKGIAQTVTGDLGYDLQNNHTQQTQLDQQMTSLVSDYKAGKISRENYSKRLQDISGSYQDLSSDAQKIQSQADRGKIVGSAAMTAADILSAGSLSVEEIGGKQVVQAGSKEALNALFDTAGTSLEQTIAKVPGVKALIMKNLEQTGVRQLAGESVDQFIVREARQLGVGMLIKRPILYQSNIGQAQSLLNNVLAGKYQGALTDAAWLASQLVSGGALGWAAHNASLLKGGIKKLAYGKDSFIDTVSSQIGNKNPAQWSRYLKTLEEKAPNTFIEHTNVSRIAQETNLRMAGEDVNKAAQNLLTHYVQRGYNLDNVTVPQIITDLQNWQKADELATRVDHIVNQGKGNIVAVSWNQADRQGILNELQKAGPTFQDKANKLIEMTQRPGVAWSNNELLVNKLEIVLNDAYREADPEKALAQGVKAIDAGAVNVEGIPKKLAAEAAKLGYTFATPAGGRLTPIVHDLSDTRKLVSSAVNGSTELFDSATAAQPQLQAITGVLQKAGLSPEAAGSGAWRKLSESVVASLDNLGMGERLGLKNTQNGDLTTGGQAILSRLQDYIESKRGVLGIGKSAATDLRQLTNGEVAEALKITKSEAKTVSHAIMEGYRNVPLEVRGLGDKVVDTLYAVNPLQKYYSRIQSALRYTYNPFFRAQERVETKLLAHAQASNLIWNKSRAELDEATRILDQGGIFTSSLPGEAAQDQVLGRITANITQGQKRDLAGLASDMAVSRGISLQQMVNEHSDEIDDALRVVVQYPRKGILASPLARTMNLAFFPMRYNLKVTQVAAQALAKQPASIQKAVLHSMFHLKDWLKSDEGIQWQSQNADAIQVFNWITPINSIEYTLNLLGHKPNSIGEVGQLGGLPLGIITQILDGQGIISLNKPYVDPKTGTVFPKYIPQTTKARAATALGDLLNSMFTYPGRTLGLPGKSAAIRSLVQNVVATKSADSIKVDQTQNLTPLQQNWVRVLKGDTSPQTIDSLYNSPAPGQFNWYTLPPLTLPSHPLSQPLQRRVGLPTKASTTKAKRVKNVAVPINSL